MHACMHAADVCMNMYTYQCRCDGGGLDGDVADEPGAEGGGVGGGRGAEAGGDGGGARVAQVSSCGGRHCANGQRALASLYARRAATNSRARLRADKLTQPRASYRQRMPGCGGVRLGSAGGSGPLGGRLPHPRSDRLAITRCSIVANGSRHGLPGPHAGGWGRPGI
jgi:hypothetical protein